MPRSMIPSFLFFCYINGITPGPANLCSLSAALNSGKEAALRQWRGLFTGFAIVALLSVLVTYFLGNVLGEYIRFLAYAGAAYLIYLALHLIMPILRPAAVKSAESGGNFGKVSFLTGLIVQLTNVKIIVFCLTALSSFVLPYTRDFLSLLLVGLFLPLTGPICNLAWLFAGVRLQALFERHKVVFNTIMAIALIYCAVTLIL